MIGTRVCVRDRSGILFSFTSLTKPVKLKRYSEEPDLKGNARINGKNQLQYQCQLQYQIKKSISRIGVRFEWVCCTRTTQNLRNLFQNRLLIA